MKIWVPAVKADAGMAVMPLEDWTALMSQIEEVNRIFNTATSVYSQGSPKGVLDADIWSAYTGKPRQGAVLKGLLINIEKVKKETSADVLRQMVDYIRSNYSSSFSEPIDFTEIKPFLKKAERALAREKEER